jgi:tetratricopeptide (TPR) repeat protein
MEKSCVRRLVVAAVFCLGRSGWGQDAELDTLKGVVYSESTPILRAVVELTDPRSHRTLARADVEPDGAFAMHYVPYGTYTITIVEDGGEPLYSGTVSVHPMTPPVELQLPRRETARPPTGPVSVDQLLHPPAKKAVAAFIAARKFSDRGAYDKAAEELEKAVRISPDYADAYVNLAAQHVHMGRYQQALEELTRAGEMAKPTVILLVDLTFVETMLKRHEDAMRSARQALQLDPSSASAHYLLGSLLAANRNTLPEAIHHLEQAARTMPAAQRTLERARQQLPQTVTHP